MTKNTSIPSRIREIFIEKRGSVIPRHLKNGIFLPAKQESYEGKNSPNFGFFGCFFKHKFKLNTLSSVLHLIYIFASNDNNFSIGKRRSFLLVGIKDVAISNNIACHVCIKVQKYIPFNTSLLASNYSGKRFSYRYAPGWYKLNWGFCKKLLHHNRSWR